MSIRKTLRIELQKLKELPPLAASTQEIFTAVNNPEVSLENLCDILEHNPPLVARLLSLSNSAYFGFPGQICSIRQAVIQVLGLNIVRSLTLGMLIGDVLDTRSCPEFNREQYWFTAVSAAFLSQRLSTFIKGKYAPDSSCAYTAGLLYNMGLLALVHKFPEAMQLVFQEANETGDPVSSILMKYYGMDHADSGGWLARRWQLPEVVCIVVSEHNNINYKGTYGDLAKLVGICSKISDALYKSPEQNLILEQKFDALGIASHSAAKMCDNLLTQLDGIRSMAGFLAGA